jgi:hypothetical protein
MKKIFKLGTLLFLISLYGIKIFYVFRKKNVFPKLILLSLTKDQLFRGGKLDDFLAFLLDDRFHFDLKSELVLIEMRHLFRQGRKSSTENLKITRDIYSYLILNYMGVRDFYKIYNKASQFVNAENNLRLNFRDYKRNIFDVSTWLVFNEINKKDIYIVTTQSQLLNLPKIFDFKYPHLNRIMMWYSTNSIPISRFGDHPSNHWLNRKVIICIDEHYVWNSDQAFSLREQGVKRCKVVGSILFYPIILRSPTSKYITYFDVTPYSNADTIYTDKYCIGVLFTISEAIKDLNEEYKVDFKLRIKPKRHYSKKHSSEYIGFLEHLARDKKVEILNPNENLYECISESVAILTIPFSSPLEISKELGVPGAYVTQDSAEWDLKSRNKAIPLLTNKQDLKIWLGKATHLAPEK